MKKSVTKKLENYLFKDKTLDELDRQSKKRKMSDKLKAFIYSFIMSARKDVFKEFFDKAKLSNDKYVISREDYEEIVLNFIGE